MTSKATKLSAGVVVVCRVDGHWDYLLLRAYNHWDFPKGMVEQEEQPLAAAIREVEEETRLTELRFEWGEDFIETGPYSSGKIARYYLAATQQREVSLPIVPELGRAEHNEFRWVEFHGAMTLITTRLMPVLKWAQAHLEGRTRRGPP